MDGSCPYSSSSQGFRRTDLSCLVSGREPRLVKLLLVYAHHLSVAFILVAPDRRLVVVRLGHSDSEQIPRAVEELADIVELYPPR